MLLHLKKNEIEERERAIRKKKEKKTMKNGHPFYLKKLMKIGFIKNQFYHHWKLIKIC